MDFDEATEVKKHEATLAAYLKKQKIQAATSATQTAIDRQQALEGDPSLANNMETLMDKKISSLMEKQFKEYIPKHVTKATIGKKQRQPEASSEEYRANGETPRLRKTQKPAQAVHLEIPTEFETDSTLPGKKRKRLSRRKAQRGKRRQFQKKEDEAAETLARLTTQRIHTAEQHTIKECRSYYGFAADPDKPLWENIPYDISQIPPQLFLEQPEAGGFHNLCIRGGQNPEIKLF
eukprot:scaffold90925_cov61-Attheya_sp.AAC.2